MLRVGDLQLLEKERIEAHMLTSMLHVTLVERVIHEMHAHLCEPLSLEDMADMACLSPFYFSRVFHNIVGVAPGEFLAALRLQAAKRLLLTTNLSVTDICFEVGYLGLGSFTTRFTQVVGLPPRHLRQRAQRISMPSRRLTYDPAIAFPAHASGLHGQVRMNNPFPHFIFIGLFPKPIPLGRPVRCTFLPAPGPFHIDHIPDGCYYVMVAALPVSENPQTYLLPGDTALVGIQGPILVRNGNASQSVTLQLHPPVMTNPPIITVLPTI